MAYAKAHSWPMTIESVDQAWTVLSTTPFDKIPDEIVDKATRAYFDAWDVERKFDFLNPKSNVVQVNMAKPMMKKALQAVVADLFEAQLEAQ